ncbi:MAG: hypothetical protein LBC82_03520 [Oscillospiraceae bacterium]|jgi:hypothetical protein|nr:hypothetical protein [Oscillospiraceae bacterium]
MSYIKQESMLMTRGKMAEIKAQEQTTSSKDKQRQRKERTRRLIKNGALAEKYLKCEGMNSGEFEKVLRGVRDKLS